MRLSLFLIAIGAAFMTAGNHLTTQPEKAEIMASQIKSDAKTRCVGRFLIDIPAEVLSTTHLTVEGVVIETKKMTLDDFNIEMTEYEKSLKTKKNEHGYKVLYDLGKVPGNLHSYYFITLSNLDDTADLGRSIEAYKWDAGYKIKLRTEGVDSIHSEFEVRVKGTPYEIRDWKVNNIPEKKELVLKLTSRVRGREKDEIPNEPGICFEDGFLSGKASYDEDVNTLFALKNKTDVSFFLNSDTNLRDLPQDTLLNRIPQIRSDLKASNTNGHIIRYGTVNTELLKAEELLLSGTTAARIPGHQFTLHANATTSSVMTPYLILEMANGGFNTFTGDKIEKASLSEDEAVALWDAVSRTLRPRPNGF